MTKELPSHCYAVGEPYSEYMKLSESKDNQTIIDIGSYRGFSAFAFAKNPTNKVHSFDIENHLAIDLPSNVNFYKKGALEIPKELIKSANIILLDVDPHDGVQEYPILKHIIDSGFKGLLIVDDVMFNEGMKNFFHDIMFEKQIIYWHHSGTGIVNII